MAFTFNVCEVFEVAEQAERNSAKFCRRFADKCRDSHTRQVLLQLAEREEGHAAGFAAISKGTLEAGVPAHGLRPRRRRRPVSAGHGK
jgi:rubrerythrin